MCTSFGDKHCKLITDFAGAVSFESRSIEENEDMTFTKTMWAEWGNNIIGHPWRDRSD